MQNCFPERETETSKSEIIYPANTICMTKKFKKKNLMAIGLLIYLIVISYLAYPKYAESGNFTEYFIVIGVTLIAIVLLWLIQTWRERYRNKTNTKDDPKP